MCNVRYGKQTLFYFKKGLHHHHFKNVFLLHYSKETLKINLRLEHSIYGMDHTQQYRKEETVRCRKCKKAEKNRYEILTSLFCYILKYFCDVASGTGRGKVLLTFRLPLLDIICAREYVCLRAWRLNCRHYKYTVHKRVVEKYDLPLLNRYAYSDVPEDRVSVYFYIRADPGLRLQILFHRLIVFPRGNTCVKETLLKTEAGHLFKPRTTTN